jgi:hypothetical protein
MECSDKCPEFGHLLDEQKHLKEVMFIQFNMMERARELQAKEYERRLEILNHEAGKLQVMKDTFITKEMYYQAHENLLQQVATVQKMSWVGVGIILALQFILRFYASK